MNASRLIEINTIVDRMLDGEQVDISSWPERERGLLERLLQAADQHTPGLDLPCASHTAFASGLSAQLATGDELEPGVRIGAFRLLERIGTGGMGVVFLAERADGEYAQRVALKVLSDSSDNASLFQLFQRERSLLAQLEHRNIARLIDGGITEKYRPWFAMEYIDGQPVHNYANHHRLSIKARLKLLLQACDALEHAHRQLILHRDIKPANLLVSNDDVLRVVDFGLGRVFDPDNHSATDSTLIAGRMTPGYASPEQARGEPIGIASEVYQLGLVLHMLLTDQLPYQVAHGNAYEVARAISEASIQRPSERWRDSEFGQAKAHLFGERAEKIRRAVAGDLDNIVLKTLAPAPEDRYSSVERLADDLQRHLQRLPVRARAATRSYRMLRFVQRHKPAVAGLAAFIALLLTSVLLLQRQADELASERDRAVNSAARSERVVDAMIGMIRLSHSDNPVEQLYSRGDLLDQYVDHVRQELAVDPPIRARLLGILGDALYGLNRTTNARSVLSDAIKTLRNQPDPDQENLIRLTRRLAETTASDGDLQTAVALLDELALQQRANHGEDSAQVADIVFQRGFLRTHHAHSATPTFASGIADMQQALAAYRQLYTPPHPKIAHAMHALGFKTNATEHGMQLLRDALAMTRELLGERHPTTTARMAEYAFAHDLRGNPARAAVLAEPAYAIHAEVRGRTHPDTMTMLGNLAGFHRAAGDFERAVTLYRELHELRQRVLPDDHLLLTIPAHGLGIALRELGQFNESERWLREALRLCQLHNSRNEAITRENLARTLAAAERKDEALAEQRAAVAAYQRHYADDSAVLSKAQQRLESMLAQR